MSDDQSSVPASPSPAEEAEPRRLSADEWQEACRDYEWGRGSLADLSRRFGISQSGLSAGFQRRGVIRGSKLEEAFNTMKVTGVIPGIPAPPPPPAAVRFEDQKDTRIEETKENHYRWADTLAKLAMKEVIDAQRSGRPFSSIDSNLRALGRATAIVRTARDERYGILKIDEFVNDQELPRLIIENYTADEVEKIKNAVKGEDELEVGDLPKIGADDLELVEEDGNK